MTTFAPPKFFTATTFELPKGFNINLPAPRLEAIRTLARGLIDRLDSIQLGTCPLNDINDRDATRWTTVAEGAAEIVANEKPVHIQFDMRFMNRKATEKGKFYIEEEHRKVLSKMLDVVQIQEMSVKGGIWKIDVRLTEHMLLGFNCKVEMRVVAECVENTNGGKRMV